jgi:hypothetical protein
MLNYTKVSRNCIENAIATLRLEEESFYKWWLKPNSRVWESGNTLKEERLKIDVAEIEQRCDISGRDGRQSYENSLVRVPANRIRIFGR